MAAEELEHELRAICQLLQIHNEREFSFRGERFHLVSAKDKTDEFEFFKLQDKNREKNSDLIDLIRDVLYNQCYVKKSVETDIGEKERITASNLVGEFQVANSNKDGWDPGWCVYKTAPDGRLFVQKGERSRMVIPGEYSTYKWPGVAPASGDMLSVRMFSGSADVQASFFFAFGKTLSDQFDEFDTVRFYFNIKAEAAVELMRLLTSALNRYLIPFKFKSLTDAKDYTRADSAVLYVARRYYHLTASIVSDVAAILGDGIREGIPLFTQKLVRGVGMADDPVGGESFGMHRCRLVAAAIVAAWRDGEQETGTRMDKIREHFSAFGCTLEAPYLRPQASNIFVQPIFSEEQQW